MESCIICTETTKEGLKKNDLCPCNYHIHNKCWIDYVHSTPRVRCLMCRKDVTAKPSAPPMPSPNAYYNISTYQLQPYSNISYDELRGTISQSHSSASNQPPIRVIIIPPDNITGERPHTNDVIFWKNKISSVIIGVVIMVGIIVLLVLLL
jgi:hypothetical protein